jgi:hypothetical protein
LEEINYESQYYATKSRIGRHGNYRGEQYQQCNAAGN